MFIGDVISSLSVTRHDYKEDDQNDDNDDGNDNSNANAGNRANVAYVS